MSPRAAIPILCLLAVPAPATPQAPRPNQQVVDILDGVDAVLLLQGKELVGKEALAVVHRGYRYLFAAPETKAEFEKDPSRYEPAYGGTCARMGARTRADPQLFAVHEGRIYLFGSDDCFRTFQAAPARYAERPAAAPSYSNAAIARGAALLEQAVRAVGGAARLQALSGWQTELLRQQPSPGGPVTYSELISVALPDRYRGERRAPFGTLITVDTPDDSFGIFVRPDGTVFGDERPLAQREALSEDVRRERARHLLALLRARRGVGVTVAAIGAARAGAAPMESVAVRSALASVTLGIDPKTGRILSEGYRDRGPEGHFGDIVLEFSDYRDVDGLSLPFAAQASFDGEPSPRLSYSVKTWTLNPELDASLFTRPAPAAKGAGSGS